jgi:hypothetical protein
MTSFMAVPGFELWADLQRQVAANFAKAAMLPMIAFSSMAHAAAGPQPRQTRATEHPKGRRAPEAAKGAESPQGSPRSEGAHESGEQRAGQAHAEFKHALAEDRQALQSATAAVLEASKSLTNTLSKTAARQGSNGGERPSAADGESLAAAVRNAAETLQKTIEELDKIRGELSRVARTSDDERPKADSDKAKSTSEPSKKRRTARVKSGSKSSSGAKSSRGSNSHRRKSGGTGARTAH